MIIRNNLSKPERLRSERRMDTLFSEGRRGFVEPLRFWWIGTPTVNTAEQNRPADTPVSALFSVPKKMFKRAWKRNLIKRRMRESYRVRKHELSAAARAAGLHIDIALVCSPAGAKEAKKAAAIIDVPDFITIDNAIAKILGKIVERIPQRP